MEQKINLAGDITLASGSEQNDHFVYVVVKLLIRFVVTHVALSNAAVQPRIRAQREFVGWNCLLALNSLDLIGPQLMAFGKAAAIYPHRLNVRDSAQHGEERLGAPRTELFIDAK